MGCGDASHDGGVERTRVSFGGSIWLPVAESKHGVGGFSMLVGHIIEQIKKRDLQSHGTEHYN